MGWDGNMVGVGKNEEMIQQEGNFKRFRIEISKGKDLGQEEVAGKWEEQKTERRR